MAQFSPNPLEQFEPESRTAGLPWRLFSISLIILFATAMVYLGLRFGYKALLNSKLAATNQKFDELSQRLNRTKDNQANFITFYSQLVNLKNLFNNHILSSKLLPFLERVTNQKVYYTNAEFKLADQQLVLEGVAQSYGTLSEQLESYNTSAEVASYLLDQSQRSESGVQFKATLTLKNNFLK